MGAHIKVDEYFEHVYLVDLSTSLCKVARARFERLGWKNVSVVCEDARTFSLPREGTFGVEGLTETRYTADLVTFSYSLSMIPGMTSESTSERSLTWYQITTV